MVTNRSFDVLDVPTDIHSDGSPNAHGTFYRAFIALSGVIAEGAEKVGFGSVSAHTKSYR